MIAVPKKAFSLIEVILAGALLAILLTGATAGLFYAETAAVQADERGRALLLAQEALEAVRSIRDANNGTINNGVYGLDTPNGYYVLTLNNDQVEEFTRSITISGADTSSTVVTANIQWNVSIDNQGSVQASELLTSWR